MNVAATQRFRRFPSVRRGKQFWNIKEVSFKLWKKSLKKKNETVVTQSQVALRSQSVDSQSESDVLKGNIFQSVFEDFGEKGAT